MDDKTSVFCFFGVDADGAFFVVEDDVNPKVIPLLLIKRSGNAETTRTTFRGSVCCCCLLLDISKIDLFLLIIEELIVVGKV